MWKKEMATSWKRTDEKEVQRQFKSKVKLELPGADTWGAVQVAGGNPHPLHDAGHDTKMQEYRVKLEQILRSSEDRDQENTYEVNGETSPAHQTPLTPTYIKAEVHDRSGTPFHYAQRSRAPTIMTPTPEYSRSAANRLSPTCDRANPYIENTTVRREGHTPQSTRNEGSLNPISMADVDTPQDLTVNVGPLDLRTTMHREPMSPQEFYEPPDEQRYHACEEHPVLNHDVSNGVYQPIVGNSVTEADYQNTTSLSVIVNIAPIGYDGVQVLDVTDINVHAEHSPMINPPQHFTASLVPMISERIHLPYILEDNIQQSGVMNAQPINVNQFVSVIQSPSENDDAQTTSINLEQFPGAIEIYSAQMNHLEFPSINVQTAYSTTMQQSPANEVLVPNSLPFSIQRIIGPAHQENIQVAAGENSPVGIQSNSGHLQGGIQQTAMDGNVETDERPMQPKKIKTEVGCAKRMRPIRPKAVPNLRPDDISRIIQDQQQQINQEDLCAIQTHFPNVTSLEEVPGTEDTEESSPASSSCPAVTPLGITNPDALLSRSTPLPERSCDPTNTQDKNVQVGTSSLSRRFRCKICGKSSMPLDVTIEHIRLHQVAS